jgi:hypothetical protein
MICSSKQRHLCGKEECKICFNRSFASYDGKTSSGKLKVDCWDNEKNGEIKPINIFRKTNKKYWFQCDVCYHTFENTPNHITSRSDWCNYCSGKKLCDKNDCNFCFNKSFASYDGKTPNGKLKVDCWDYKKNGEIKPINICKHAHIKTYFICDICNKSWGTAIYNISIHNWCPHCKGKYKSTDDIINEFKKIHGNTYNYSKVVYVNSLESIIIGCHKHGDFLQLPNVHKRGCGCPICAEITRGETQKLNVIKNLLRLAINIHGDKYDYSKVDYIDSTIPVLIYCKKCKKYFNMLLSNHTRKQYPQNCPKCKCAGYSKKQIQWLDFISILHNITIQHAINNKEYKIKNIGKVDGYCEENNTVYEFHGDLWHGNPMEHNILDKNAINPVNKKTYYELYETTLKRDKKIKELGYNLVIMWENQWDKINNSIKLLQNKWRDYKNKPHKCEKCNISFKFKSQLEKHCKTELHKTGKKKTRSDKKEEFKCEICNLYTTNQQTNLKLHILNNHKTKEERKNEFPYYCELCDSGCMEEKLYKKHLETKKHKKKLDLLSK